VRVLLVAEEATGIAVLRHLVAERIDLAGVVAEPPASTRGASTWTVATEAGLRTWPAACIQDPAFAETIRAEGVDLLINVYTLRIIPRAVLEAPRLGCYNCHPGPLPEYAGRDVVSWAIYNEESEYSVTLHLMTEQVDAGPIAYEDRFPITRSDTARDVFLACGPRMLGLVKRLLHDARRGRIPAHPIDQARFRLHRNRPPNRGWIDWRQPSRRIASFVRACDFRPFPSPWGLPRARVEDRLIEVVQADETDGSGTMRPGTVTDVDSRDAVVATTDGFLRLRRVRVDGRVVKAGSVLQAGDRIQGEPPTAVR